MSLHDAILTARRWRVWTLVCLSTALLVISGCGGDSGVSDASRDAPASTKVETSNSSEADRGVREGEAAPSSAEPNAAEADEAEDRTVGGGDGPRIRVNAVESLKAREPAPFPQDWIETEPLVAEMIEQGWARSPISRDELDQVVAVVNGEELTGLDLAKECLLRWGGVLVNGNLPFDDLARELMSLAEVRHAGIEITEEELDVVATQALRKANARDMAHHEQRTGECPAIFRLKAKGELARRKLFARDKNRPEFREKDALEYIEWSPYFVAHYPHALASEYGYARLPEGAGALMNDVPLSLDIALPYVLSFVGPIQREISIDDLIDATVLRQELDRLGVSVDPAEVDLMVEERERTKAGGLIPWRLLLRSKGINDRTRGVSVGYVRRTFKCWLALDKIAGELDEADVLRYFDQQTPMIGRASIRLAAIRFPLLDGEEHPLGPIDEAKVRIDLDKALDALRDGVPFFEVAAKYSRDPETRRWTEVDGVEGRVCGDVGLTNIRDGVLREELSAAGFLARSGQWIGPIRTPRGLEIVMPYVVRAPSVFSLDDEPYNDVNGNGRYDADEPYDDLNFNQQWDAGRRFFALNEARRDRGLAFIADARERADIEMRWER